MEKLSEFLSKKVSLQTKGSSEPPDYHEYVFSRVEWVLYTGEGIFIAGFLTYLFYRSLFAMIFLCPVIPFFIKAQQERLCRKRRESLKLQFKDAIQSVSAALQAGYAMENAVREAGRDMENMYGAGGLITKEFCRISEGIRNNRTPEELFAQLAERSGLEDIRDFAEVFATAKRSGGDLPSVIRVCSITIGDKIETAKEISTLLASKRLEGRIMDVIPCFMILYIDGSSPGFFDMLYHSLMGRVVMTICLVIYIGAIFLSEKIMSIEV